MMKKLTCLFFLSGMLFTACRTSRTAGDDGLLSLNIIQVNDVYEIAPLENGKSGGMARLSALKKQYASKNKNTILIMAGDFLSPSVFNSLKVDNVRVRGKQMVEAMNAAGMDLVVFGNHEFDITEQELQSRLNESVFEWVSTNTFHKTPAGTKPFNKIQNGNAFPLPASIIKTFTDIDGTTVRIGFIGVTLPFNKAAYVDYTDLISSAKMEYEKIRGSCDAVIAITHQLVEDDIKLARQIPGLSLIMGGHEHDMRFEKTGNIFITKAHANSKSAYVNLLTFNKKKNSIKVEPELVMLDENIPQDPQTAVVVNKWVDIANRNFSSIGFNPDNIVLEKGEPLDGREALIRSQRTNLTDMIVAAMEKAAPMSDVVIVNSGSIRVDDILYMPVNEYDIIRTLPFGGSIVEADMQGELLTKILTAGKNNLGIGGFLHYSGSITFDGTWKIKGKEIINDQVYRVALTDFLVTGGEANLGFLKPDNPGIVKMHPVITDLSDARSDIRLALIRYLKK